MPLGASRLTLLAFQASVAAEATVIRKKHGISANGNAQIDTAQSQYGSASADFDGSNSYLTNYDNWDVTDNWTLEFYIRTDSLAGQYPAIFYFGNQSTSKGWAIEEAPGGNLSFISSNDGSSGMSVRMTASSVLTASTWHHVAIVVQSTSGEMFVDGTSVATGTVDPIAGDSSSVLRIGGGQGGLSSGNFGGNTSIVWYSGHLDDIRISNTARYTRDFEPNGPFVNDDNTLLLLHMDGTDGSTTFIDDNGSSTSEFNEDDYASYLKLAVPFDDVNGVNDVAKDITGTGITSAATVTQGASSVVSGGAYWNSYNSSLINNQDGQALVYTLPSTMPSSTSSTFVVEAWIRATDSTNNNNWTLSSADSGGRWLFSFNTTSSVGFGGENNIGLSDTNWHHIAIVCNSGTHAIYKDGLYLGAWGSANTGFTNLNVGQFNAGDNNDFRGQIQDLRVYQGTNKGYTGTFTGSRNFALPGPIKKVYPQMPGVTAHGDAKVQTADSKFGGGSVIFDGAGDNLRVFPQWDVSNPWTLEFFFKTGSTGNMNMFSMTQSDASTESNSVFIRANSGKVQIYTSTVGGTSWNVIAGVYTSGSYSTTDWNHYALQWDGANMKQFLNGSEASSTSHPSPVFDNKYYENYFGGAFGSTAWFNGAFDEIRISSTARYSGSYTVPTAAFVPDQDTKFLLHCDGTNNSTDFIPDAGVTRSACGIEAVNQAETSTDQAKFGVSSFFGDGTDDCLMVHAPGHFDFGTGDFTWEAFVRYDSTASTNMKIIDFRRSSTNGTGETVFDLSSYRLRYFVVGVGAAIYGSTVLSQDTWYHVALVRNSGTTTIYLDGTSEGTYSDSENYNNTSLANGYGATISVGANNAGTSQEWNGYIDEVRISNTARYTSGFTAPTEPFQNDANTLLLLHMDGTDGSTTFIDDNGQES